MLTLSNIQLGKVDLNVIQGFLEVQFANIRRIVRKYQSCSAVINLYDGDLIELTETWQNTGDGQRQIFTGIKYLILIDVTGMEGEGALFFGLLLHNVGFFL